MAHRTSRTASPRSPDPATSTMPSSGRSPSPATTSSPLPSPSRATRRLSTQTMHGGSHKSVSPPGNDGSEGGDTVTTEVVAAVVVAGLLFVAACAYSCRSKRRRAAAHHPPGGLMFYADSSGFKGNTSAYYYTTGGARPPWQNQVAPSPSNKWQQQQQAASPAPAPAPPPADATPSATGSHGGGLPPPVPPPPLPLPAGIDAAAFSYEELAAATGGFAAGNVLGQGGFGYVYKGVLPGAEVAVKQLKAGSGQGEREFQAEVDTISRVHHRHLVSLVGYCIAGAQRLLVYQFVPNRTLEHHLHGKGVPVMEWTTRLRIAIGAAKGLAYLHEECDPRIIHRDIKSANILLDNDFEAMVADFGLAKLTNVNHTHVSTRVMGTFGYLAPEYASSGKLTAKSDVFSYGVMLLELLTGRRPGDRSSYGQDGLVDWARVALSCALADGNYDAVVDPRLDGDYDAVEVARVVASAAACIRHAGRRRPKMSQIVRALQGQIPLEELNDGVRPGQSVVLGSSSGSESECGSGSYTAQMERIRRAALASPEYSAEYPGSVPEYGHPSPASSAASSDPDDRRRRARR